MQFFILFLLFSATFFGFPEYSYAYIGPGAGFAFLGSSFVFVLTILMAIATLALWPIQWAIRRIRRRGVGKNARAKRVVIVGLDGLEPTLTEKFMAEGKMPHLKSLMEQGSYRRLGTTLPALSPVAWSSFQTGVNPGAHNIFDFLTRDKRTCLPLLSSTDTEIEDKSIRIFGLKIPRSKTKVVISRKSTPFWKILGKYGIFSNIIRVPISYPPEKFTGNILSAMCTPDLKGTQGSFSFFTSDSTSFSGQATGGGFQQLEKNGEFFIGEIDGPPSPIGKGYLKAPFSLRKIDALSAEMIVDKKKYVLTLNQFSDWIELNFTYKRSKISGIVRVCLRQLEPSLNLYISPVNANPAKPALPIAQPIIFASWLAKQQGLFGTLGLLEDTWGRNEHAIDDQRFLDQSYLTHFEREKMFFDVIKRTREGVCACVFDASDRIQHMFWRYMSNDHPAPVEDRERFGNVIPEMYQKMDDLIGRVLKEIKNNDLLFVMSDHGFAPFKRGININSWLRDNGYLTLKDNKQIGADYFQDVDWSRTKAYAVGLAGLYINVKGREVHGIVPQNEVAQIKADISKGLESLLDPKDSSNSVRKVYDTAKEYRGLYAKDAPDLIVGYAPGYRCSWDSVTGTTEEQIFSDNTKAWSGDHHVDPRIIPGVLFSNRKIKTDSPNIVDLAPTVLDVFSVKVPPYMEGKVLV